MCRYAHLSIVIARFYKSRGDLNQTICHREASKAVAISTKQFVIARLTKAVAISTKQFVIARLTKAAAISTKQFVIARLIKAVAISTYITGGIIFV